MYSQTLSIVRFCNCFSHPHFKSIVPPPSNYVIKPPTQYDDFRSLTLEKTSATVDRNRRVFSCNAIRRSDLRHLFDVADNNEEDGPIELPQELNPFEVPEATPLQITASIVLTGSIAVLLYRSLKRRAKRGKEMRFRSSGVENVRKEAKSEALKALKQLNSAAQEVKPSAPTSALQALLGAIIAGVIAFVLYNFAITVQSSLDSQVVSPNYSVRQITITVRTILNGICYLATFVFAANSIGLTLYSGQLALQFWINIITGKSDSKPVETENKTEAEVKDDNP